MPKSDFKKFLKKLCWNHTSACATKDDISDFLRKDFDDKKRQISKIMLEQLNKKTTSNKSKCLLVKNELKKITR